MKNKITKIKNLDYLCYKDAAREHSEHQEDWLVQGYAPKGFYVKDFCLIRIEDTWHLFHIAGTPGVSCCLPGNELWFGHATTRDFRHWTTHLPCFYIDPSGWDCGHVFAPYVIEHGAQFWMFYTGCSIENAQRIGVAVSSNLFDWHRAASNPVIRPEEYEWAYSPADHGGACRDPHISKISDEFILYYTAVTNTGHACVASARSTNLLDWHDRGPAYTAPALNHCESSNMQRLGDKYLLFFGGHYEYWSYVVSDNPVHWPEQEPIPLKKGITAMEVVSQHECRWLVAYFKMDCYRLFLGIIDWSVKHPTIDEISDVRHLTEFGV